jgi:FkbM family methyltransferase
MSGFLGTRITKVKEAALPTCGKARYDSSPMAHPSTSDSQSSRWQRWRGLGRSIAVYYGNPLKLRRMQRFYAQFIGPGDLCFDIGAHVGNRILIWSRLGANIVAVEPQPSCLALLRHWYGQSPRVTLVGQALGAAAGRQTLRISSAHPTVTTLSESWIEAVQASAGFAQVQWEETASVEVTTLDALIARFGAPAFCKIDIEGYEGAALAGLTQPLKALSFEFIPAAKADAAACLARLQQLGEYEFNWSLGEQHRWQSRQWLDQDQMAAYIDGLQVNDPSGDIYARLLCASRPGPQSIQGSYNVVDG